MPVAATKLHTTVVTRLERRTTCLCGPSRNQGTLKRLLSGRRRYGHACKPGTCWAQIDAGSTHFYKTRFVVHLLLVVEIAQMVSLGRVVIICTSLVRAQ